MAQVLYVYKEAAMLHASEKGACAGIAILSKDEKPGIQAIETTQSDVPPRLGKAVSWARDHEYVRHGTLSLMAGIDLLSGRIHGIVANQHRTREFIAFLKLVDQQYPPEVKIRFVLCLG